MRHVALGVVDLWDRRIKIRAGTRAAKFAMNANMKLWQSPSNVWTGTPIGALNLDSVKIN